MLTSDPSKPAHYLLVYTSSITSMVTGSCRELGTRYWTRIDDSGKWILAVTFRVGVVGG